MNTETGVPFASDLLAGRSAALSQALGVADASVWLEGGKL